MSVYDPACACDAVADAGRDVLYFIDPQTLTVNASVPLGGDPYGIAFANSTAELWVTLGGLFGPSGVEVLNASYRLGRSDPGRQRAPLGSGL